MVSQYDCISLINSLIHSNVHGSLLHARHCARPVVTWWLNKQGLSFCEADTSVEEMENKQSVVGNTQEENREWQGCVGGHLI